MNGTNFLWYMYRDHIPSAGELVEVSCSKRSSCVRVEDSEPKMDKHQNHTIGPITKSFISNSKSFNMKRNKKKVS
jgi:hypothetical protein